MTAQNFIVSPWTTYRRRYGDTGSDGESCTWLTARHRRDRVACRWIGGCFRDGCLGRSLRCWLPSCRRLGRELCEIRKRGLIGGRCSHGFECWWWSWSLSGDWWCRRYALGSRFHIAFAVVIQGSPPNPVVANVVVVIDSRICIGTVLPVSLSCSKGSR